ncbi:metallophosphoesterase family protein [Chthonobacter rhizosphaerae]|uniref:metallophosphoesterase family protein n=1 Tax=Chthonobacter rhizosphaerae TaxID=2735553 RepID=UPI001AEE9515|nr:metallophosphoesterase family protein [Chthonobacter rhizosphaerae]
MFRLLDRLLGSARAAARDAVPDPDRHVVAPDDASIYAVGDVHGCADLLHALEARILQDARARRTRALILYLGDLIDRGPDSAAVLDHLSDQPDDGVERLCLLGNHEAMLLDWLSDPADDGWLEHGGGETLRSYGVPVAFLQAASARRRADIVAAHLPRAHVDFLEALPLTVRTSRHLFVHAGVRPGVPLAAQTESDLLWIREPFLSRNHGLDLPVVHGHTPTPEPTVLRHRIGIDTGAFATGRLCAVRLVGDEPPAILGVSRRAPASSAADLHQRSH